MTAKELHKLAVKLMNTHGWSKGYNIPSNLIPVLRNLVESSGVSFTAYTNFAGYASKKNFNEGVKDAICSMLHVYENNGVTSSVLLNALIIT